MPRILCLAGSLREAASSRAVVATLCDELAGRADMRRFDIGALPHYNADLHPAPAIVDQFKDEIASADGMVIVTPEYNYSVPGVLKNAIDWASRPGYASVLKDKPVFFASVSGGALGGVRAQAHLKNILLAVLARPFIWQEIVITHANNKVKDGRLDDEGTLNFLMEAVGAFLATLEPRPR
jgi:chromate reductase